VPAEKKKQARPQPRPTFWIVQPMVEPGTGEEKMCLVASNQGTRDEMKRRKFTRGTRLKVEMARPRNLPFWRKAHVLAELCIYNIEAFEGLDQHAALKKLQLSADAECEHLDFRLADGTTYRYREAKTLSFDSMDEGTFTQVYDRIVEHIKDRWFSEWSQEQMDALIELTDRNMGWQ
jgi:hypothetical protein